MRVFVRIFLILSFLFCVSLSKGQNHLYKLKLESKENLCKEIIKSYENIETDSLGILQDLKKIIDDFQLEGYWAASIDTLRFETQNVYASIYQGKQYEWGSVDFSNLEKEIIEDLNLNQINKKNNVSEIELLQKTKSEILTYFENSGYPFVQVYFETIDLNDSTFNAKLQIEKGESYIIDSVIVKGDAKISSVYIRKALQIQENQFFNQQKINNISSQVSNIRFLSEIKPAEIEFKQNGVDLYLYLEDKKANMFNGIIGFLPENEETGKLLITGDLKLDLVNPFGKGEEVSLNWEKLESSTQKLNVGFNYPYLFKSNFGLDAAFGLYKKDSTFLSLNFDLGLRFFLNNNDYIKGYYRYKNSSRIGEENSLVSDIKFADVKSNIFGAAYYLNTLDYRMNPRKGIEVKLLGGVGVKKLFNTNNTIDSLNIDNRTLEIESELDLNIYIPIYNNFVFHFGNRTRYMDQFSDEETLFFENELYRFGGAKTLKGFDENIFSASIYSLQNIEVKYLFERNSSFYVFWNGAYYYQNIEQNTAEDFPWGVGVGMDFDTKAGIFSLSYAVGKQFDNPIEIRTAKIHFGYISRF
ncbi:MAG: hypothetical protein JEY96_08565 [Bacteroidales bacterium]|nr:hypothetical protein [Bacteroidales bacterium]